MPIDELNDSEQFGRFAVFKLSEYVTLIRSIIIEIENDSIYKPLTNSIPQSVMYFSTF